MDKPIYLIFNEFVIIWIVFSIYSKRGFNVKSYGTGSHVKLPGPAADKPNVYPFTTPYDHMYKELYKKDSHLYPFFWYL